MRETMTIVFGVGFAGMALLLPILLYHDHRLNGILRARHPEVWKSLGSPAFFLKNSPNTILAVRSYIRHRRHLALADAELNGVIARKRVGEYVYIACLVVCVVAVFVGRWG